MHPIKVFLIKAQWRTLKLFPPLFRRAVAALKLDVEEDPSMYIPGGFHPVSIGDTFHNNQYTVLRKLGYGQYSTVWLARDEIRERYVTLKVLRADSYGGSHDIFEVEMHSKICQISKESSHQGRDHVLHYLDTFKHKGPNGEHVCLVFDVLGHHLNFQKAHFENRKLPAKCVKSIAKQLLLGLDFLHRECNIIHTDLKPTNILVQLENPDQVVSQYLSEVAPRMTDAHTPLREVIKTPIMSETNQAHVRIIDFGVSSWGDNHLSEHIQSPFLRAPEVVIGVPWNSAVDIWSLGCILVELLQGIVLFPCQGCKRGKWTAEDDHLGKITELLGPIPLSFIRQGSRASHFFDEHGKLVRVTEMPPTSLDRMLNGATKPFMKPEDMSDDEIGLFIDFIKGMLTIDPGSRKSAAELLHHEWLQS
ncbi:hypothetical protein E4U43_007287 [Claviceps pusilla]|uniref:non-specific serine/threonine protein kinase n=1 Tax=Claviceps pusilla TaxID=123648 RepID=A0A9P7T1P7_9HYPO|nr:hypothetical protein E4U43_007287 [Claviceps pusilla]